MSWMMCYKKITIWKRRKKSLLAASWNKVIEPLSFDRADEKYNYFVYTLIKWQ